MKRWRNVIRQSVIGTQNRAYSQSVVRARRSEQKGRALDKSFQGDLNTCSLANHLANL